MPDQAKSPWLKKIASMALWDLPVVAIGCACALLTFAAFFIALALTEGHVWIAGGMLAFNLFLIILLTSSLQVIRKSAQEARACAVQQAQFKRAIQDAVQQQRQVEKELGDSERLFRFLTEHSLAGILMMDAEGKRTYVNPAWSQISGLTQEQAMGLGWMQNIHPEDRAEVQRHFVEERDTLENGLKIEFRFLTPDGKVTWVYAQAAPFYNTNGVLAGYLGTCIDITEHKKAEEAVQSLQRELANIIDFLPDATLVIDNNKKVIAWNRAIEKLTGISKAEVIGQDAYAFTIPFYGERRKHLLDLLDVDDADLKAKYQHVQREDGTLYAETFAPALV